MSRIEVVANLIRMHKYTSYCEVGVKRGRMISDIVRATGCRGIAVDAWENIPNDGESYDQWDFADIEASYWKAVKGLDIQTLKMRSVEAAQHVEQVDLVFIDAAHDEANVTADIQAWRPKCKLISGHDYDDKFPGVKAAVDRLVPDRQLRDDFVWWSYA